VKKTCKKCNLSKNIENFRVYKRKCKNNTKFCFRFTCLSCERANSKQYIRENPEKARKNGEKWRKNNPNYQKQYKINNKDKIKQYRREYESKITIKLRKRISKSIYYHLKANNSLKNNKSILNYLPYSIDELKKHLESLFEPWMNWDNHGNYNQQKWDDNNPQTWTWQIDHIIPQSNLPYDSMDHPNFKKCWALKNLRPLRSKENVLDGAKRTRHIIFYN